jgi:hypothetical protein
MILDILHILKGSSVMASSPSYYTAGTNGTFDNQFTHVLKGGQDPLDTYEYEGEQHHHHHPQHHIPLVQHRAHNQTDDLTDLYL